MRIQSSIFLDLITTSFRDGDAVEMDDSILAEFLSIISEIKRYTSTQQKLVVDANGAVWYGDREVHIPPKPRAVLQRIITGGAASKENLISIVGPHVKKHVKDLNDSLADSDVPGSVSYSRNRKLYEFS